MGTVPEGQVRPSQFTRDVIPSSRSVRLNATDIARVIEIAKEGFPTVWTPSEFAYFVDNACGYCHGWIENDEIMAYLIALLVDGDLDIVSLSTHPSRRRFGLARKLLSEVLTDPRIARIFLEVDVENSAALKLYESMGFKRTGIRKGYYEKKRDAYRMELLPRPIRAH